MPLTEACGPHCGTRPSAEARPGIEAHCECAKPCHKDSPAPIVITREDLTAELRGTPMCWRWYERAGDYRPWDR